MKKLKKLSGLFLALAMVLSLNLTVFAAEPESIERQTYQVEVGGDHGDLDQLVMEDVQAGHLAVDPDQAGILRRVGLVVMCVHHRVPRFLRTCTEQTTIYHL